MTQHNYNNGDARLAFYDDVCYAIEPDKNAVRMMAAAMRTEHGNVQTLLMPLFIEYALRAGIKEFSARQLFETTKASDTAIAELMDTWKAAQAEEANASADLDELLECDANEPDIEFATELLTPLQDVTLLSANGGVGKTMLALFWLLCIAAGRMFFGLKTTQSPVLFVTAEDRRIVCAKRLAAISANMHLYFQNPFTKPARDNFHLWEILGKPLWIEDRKNVAGIPTSTLFDLERRIKEIGARQVAIDNASSVFCANHNDNVQVTAFLTYLRRMAERTNCNILLLGHVSADTASGSRSKTYYGSTAWHNAVRSRMFMELRPAEDGVDEHIRVVHEKSNYGRLARPFNLQRDESTGALRLLSDQEIAQAIDAKVTGNASDLLTDIKAVYAKGGYVVSGDRGSTNSYSCLSEHFPNKYPEGDRGKRREVKNALSRLSADKQITKATRTTGQRNCIAVWVPAHDAP